MKMILWLALLCPLFASAQTSDILCLPQPLGDAAYASPLYVRHVPGKGTRIRWHCWEGDDASTPPRTYTYYILNSELDKVGGRLKTILGATDPLQSAQGADKRFPVMPLDDPAFEATFGALIEALK